MILRRLFIAIVFLLALHLNLNRTLHSVDFEVNVYYEFDEISIVTDTNFIHRSFTSADAEDAAVRDKDLYIGTYSVTVTSDSSQVYQVYVSANSEYVNSADNRFQSLTVEGGEIVKMSVIGNRNPDGSLDPRPFFNDQIVIDHGGTFTDPVVVIEVDHYCLSTDITNASNNFCRFPISYRLEGA